MTRIAHASATILAARAWVLVAFICLLAACAGLPQQIERVPSRALPDNDNTRLARAIAPQLAAHPGESGFFLLGQGAEAFVARIVLVREAQRSIDIQYYIFHADSTGLSLVGELLAAADRGVRVRVLLDDIHLKGQDDALAAIDSHPNIEVRLFNPFANRRARWLDFAGDFGRVNRRMHNKSMIVDGQASIVGGRNIGDEYFAAKPELDFSDLDVLTVGPVVADVSVEFDEYWNSDVVYPITSLISGPPPSDGALRELHADIAEYMQSLKDTPYAQSLRETGLVRALAEKTLRDFWGKATVIADHPSKITRPPDDRSGHAIVKLGEILGQAKEELILVSPYFVPGEDGTNWLRDIARRGVRVTILTNSFEATDVSAVHAGYSPYRISLLQDGIQLYELKRSAGLAKASGETHLGGSSRASLHAKTYMVDRHRLFVGSLNLDPRSANLNTEMGVVLDSASMCAILYDDFRKRLRDDAYRVEIDTQSDPANPRLVWISYADGRETRIESEPGMGVLRAIGQQLLRILPVEEQL